MNFYTFCVTIITMNTINQLNPAQKEAVLHKDGPLLVIAGAGAGKTMVITHRIANLIQNNVRPDQILAVTFTNKAASEMRERIIKLIAKNNPGQTYSKPSIGTFHSICVRILRQNGRACGLTQNFSILDKEDSLKIIKKSLKILEIDPKQFQPRKMQSIISKQKSNLVKLEDYIEEAGIDYFPKTVASIWEEYEKALVKQKAADFDDLISKVVFLFQERPEILEKYQDKWPYILIDEYQDTNHSQYKLIKMLAQKYKNLCVVGDEDQSIYSFRGANFGNILNFEKDWPAQAGKDGAKIIMLEQNYRSSQKILEAANAVISKNKMRKNKNLFSELDQGEDITVFDASTEKEEGYFIAKSCEQIIQDGKKPKDIAILYRANFQSRVLEEAFISNGIPYQVVGTKFFERKEIKDILGFVKAALNPDDLISLERIINEPPRGLGKTSLMNHLAGKTLPTARAKKMKDFFDFLKLIKDKLKTEPLSKSLGYIIKESGYQKNLNKKTEEGMMRSDNLRELLILSLKYDSLKPTLAVENFLEDTALMSAQDEINEEEKIKKGSVRLMTVHAAKGLEFPYVFIAGLEEGLFPYNKISSGKDEEEEERRLFYVALTRAREKLYLSFAHSRTLFGGRQMNSPSRFVNEIPPELFSDEETSQSGETVYCDENGKPTTNYLDF